jgi:hypothetical protein
MGDAAAGIDEVIAGIKPPEGTVPLCLRGDLQAQWEDLERQLQTSQQTERASLAGNSSAARDLLQQMDEIAEEMRDHERIFRFRGLSHRAYSDLYAAHRLPQEEIEEGDTEGINRQTFPVALVAACCVDPAMTVAQAEKLCDAVTDGQWEELFVGARRVNRSLVNVPPMLSSSAIRAATEPKPKPPEPGESADAASSAGSLAG